MNFRRITTLLPLIIVHARAQYPGTMFVDETGLAVYNLVNAARVNPRQYQAMFGGKFSCSTVSGLAPLDWVDGLYSSSKSHSNDMKSHPGCFQHDTCGCRGSSCGVFDRIKRYYSDGTMGENIVMNGDRLGSVKMWLESEGHCKNIFSSSFRVTGVAFTEEFGTQNFAGTNLDRSKPRFYSAVATKGRFLAFITLLPAGANVSVVANGVRTGLSQVSGGLYVGDASKLATCQTYYFEIQSKDGTASARFPSKGSLSFQCSSKPLWQQDFAVPPPAPVVRSISSPTPAAQTRTNSNSSSSDSKPSSESEPIPNQPAADPDQSGQSDGKEQKLSQSQPGVIGGSVFAFTAISLVGFISLRAAHLKRQNEPVDLQGIFTLNRSQSRSSQSGNSRQRRPDSIVSISGPDLVFATSVGRGLRGSSINRDGERAPRLPSKQPLKRNTSDMPLMMAGSNEETPPQSPTKYGDIQTNNNSAVDVRLNRRSATACNRYETETSSHTLDNDDDNDEIVSCVVIDDLADQYLPPRISSRQSSSTDSVVSDTNHRTFSLIDLYGDNTENVKNAQNIEWYRKGSADITE